MARNVNLHPSSHHPSALKSRSFDIIFIGAGPVANFGAARLASAGLSVLVAEASLYGGDCPYWACIPSKALLRPLDALSVARSVGGSQEAVQSDVNSQAVFTRRDKFVNNWDDSFLAGLAESKGVTIARGWGRLEGTKRVSVQPHGEDKKFFFDAKFAVILATGSVATMPDIQGLDSLEKGKELWDPADATAASAVPNHLIVLGAGAVGTESATTYVGLGGKVTVVSPSAEILHGFEAQASERVRKALEEQGVQFKLGCRALSVSKADQGAIEVTLSNGTTVQGSTVLIAAGRKARTVDVGLESIGKITLDAKGAISTDESLTVNTNDKKHWLYAIGDTNGRNPTTHSGTYHARIASNAILDHLKKSLSSEDFSILKVPDTFLVNTTIATEPHAIPRTIFTHPGIASVGHTLASAHAASIQARRVSTEFKFPGAFLWADGQVGEGWACWIIDDQEVLIGATYVAHQVEDFLLPATLAVAQRLKIKDLVGVVPCFPTRGEVWRILLDQAGY